MPLNPAIINLAVIASFFRDYKSAVRNIVFILIFIVVNQVFGNYLFEQANKYQAGNIDNSPPNYAFGFFLLFIVIADLISFQLKYQTLRVYAYTHKKFIEKDSGCISAIESILIGFSMFFNAVPTILLSAIVFNALNLATIFKFIIAIAVFIKWIYIFGRSRLLTPNEMARLSEAPVDKSSLHLKNFTNILITLSSTVIYVVVWRVCIYDMIDGYRDVFAFNKWGYGTEIALSLLFGSVVLYLPSRLLFVLEDYYSITDLKRKRAAFLTSILAILVPIVSAILSL